MAYVAALEGDAREMPGALDGLLVVSVEQAVAAPYCSARLADAGARVIKIERPEGDFARGYDSYVHGLSSYFVWLNRGKQSVTLDFRKPEDAALLQRLIGQADVLIQNLAPGAAARAGFGSAAMRAANRRLITVDVSGYGDHGPYRNRRAYDLLVQAESGLASVTGGPEAPARVGVSVTDVACGMNAYEAVLEAIIGRGRSGQGAAISVSLFDAMADWMTVPLLHHEGGKPPQRLGLAHPSIAPYGVFKSREGIDILISIQNDREWRILATDVMGDAALAADAKFATVRSRVQHRAETDGKVAASFATMDVATLSNKLLKADIAFARVNDVAGLIAHPHLRRISVETPHGPVSYPAPAPIRDEPRAYRRIPALGEHTEKVRREFS